MAFSISTLLDPIGTAKASIQAYVGEFLTIKAQLQPLTLSNNAQTAQQAQQFMQTQLQLEGQLPNVLATVNTLSAGDAFSANGIQVATFATQLTSYMSSVKAFLGPAGTANAQAESFFGLGVTQTQVVVAASIAVIGLVMGRTMLGVVGGVGYLFASKTGAINF